MSPRTAASLGTIYYSQKNSTGADPLRVYYTGQIVNTSRCGVGLLTSYPHQPHEELWFEAVGNARRAVHGTVQWITKRQNQYGVGIRLTEDTG